MGVYLSTTAYSPMAFTSAIIGFISFVFTLGTFLKVVWINLETMMEPSHEVHGMLTGLRTELLEEKASIRTMRRQSKRFYRQMQQDGMSESLVGVELDEVTLKTMGDSVKGLIRRFRELERPFLESGNRGIDGWKDHRHKARRRGSDGSPYYEHSAYANSPPEKGGRRGSRGAGDVERGRVTDKDDTMDEEEAFWAQRTRYAPFDFGRRLVWIRKKSEAQSLFETLSRVQTRRIARQVGGMSILMHEYGSKTCRVEELMERLDERMNRIVGVRRVE